ncbi:MAG TPA: response regulator [Acidobacteriaceae bacterium]|jgi:CheY-like chemotaxis protein|nr:response regulator [Acidobacteriaceae bacterium]
MSDQTPARRRILIADDDAATRRAVARLLENAGFEVSEAADGNAALSAIQAKQYDLVFLDVWMPHLSGLEVLAHLRTGTNRPKVIVMTSDATSETLLRAVKEQAYDYVSKPFPPRQAVELAQRALSADGEPAIEVLSARPHWVELLIPCTREAAERMQTFMMKLEADLPVSVRETIASSFRELLLNAVEWGGQFDPNRKVRIASVRSSRMLMFRIADPGPGFSFEKLSHAAVGQPESEPIAHMSVREERGIRPGGFGILMTKASADELLYNEAQNEVMFIKYLDDANAIPAKTEG